jgi:hydrogenase maturation factor HypF (carbamoyltransferase family)
MLPYTGLHYLLFDDGQQTMDDGNHSNIFRPMSVLVMTSGNLVEPIATDNEEARERLGYGRCIPDARPADPCALR